MTEAKSDIAGSLVPMTKQQAMLMLEAAYLWMDLGKFDNARELLNGATVLMPKSEVPQLALGTLEFNQQHFEKALPIFRRAQQLAPRASLPRAHVGETLLFMGKVNEAMKELKAALELEPGSDGAKFAEALIAAKESGALPPPNKQQARK
ncbi:MAG: tetratricopeptide repeat protein [Myxococcota bacterium]